MVLAMNLHTNPAALSEMVRNIVLARAHAGHLNGERAAAIRLACREAARGMLGKRRLSSREANECDALAGGGSSHMVHVPAQFAVASTDHAPVLAMLARIEALLMTLVALLLKRSVAAPSPEAPPVPISEWSAPRLGTSASNRSVTPS